MHFMSNVLFSVFPNERFVDLGLYQYGWEQCEPLHSYGPYVRNHYLFHYVISGTGTLTATDFNGESHTYRLKSGEGFMIFPKQVTSYSADEKHPWEYTWLEFDGLRVKEALDLAGLTVAAPIYHTNSRDLSQELKNEMLYITNHSDFPPLKSHRAPVSVFRLPDPLLLQPEAAADRKASGFLCQGGIIFY